MGISRGCGLPAGSALGASSSTNTRRRSGSRSGLCACLALRRAQVEDFIVARAAKHPRSATDELQFLKRVLREARDRGQRVDEAVLSIKPGQAHSASRARSDGRSAVRTGVMASWAFVAVGVARGPGWCASGVLVRADRRHARPGRRDDADPGGAGEEQVRASRVPDRRRGCAIPRAAHGPRSRHQAGLPDSGGRAVEQVTLP